VVEKSADVIKACHKYFMLPTDNRFSVEMDDAGCYLERSADGGFDLIMVDLFDSTTMPTCMRTVDLYNRCRQILSDQGVLSINLLVKDEQEFVLILKLIRDAFDGRTLCLTVAGRMNVIVLAFKNQPEDICFDDIEAKAERLEDMYKLDFVSYVHNIFDTNPTNDDGQLLL
jgi:spermidine synthase